MVFVVDMCIFVYMIFITIREVVRGTGIVVFCFFGDMYNVLFILLLLCVGFWRCFRLRGGVYVEIGICSVVREG